MIKFGTDGWRGKIAEDFTFLNVRLVASAIANYIKKRDLSGKGLIISYDNRFNSEKYAEEAAAVVSAAGIKVYLSEAPAPSPAISFQVIAKNAAGAIMITASHNPPEWNGIKFKADYGGSASPEITSEIEKEINIPSPRLSAPSQKAKIEKFNPKVKYFDALQRLVDLKLIGESKVRVVADPMHGSALGYLPEVLSSTGLNVIEINSSRDPLFGGRPPEPLPGNLEELISNVRELALRYPDELVVGIALDGDGDRVAAIDGTGAFINPHNIFSIILLHLTQDRKLKGEVVKTFNITKMIDKLAKKYNLKLHETPIGFKYICDLMLKEDILIGGEESGGIGIKNHIPERDGILAALLLLETMAFRGKTLGKILDEMMKEFGYYFYDRTDLKMGDEKKVEILNRLKKSSPKEFAGQKVVKIEDLDGIKLILSEEAWILFRASGTEPLLRIYVEARTPEAVKTILSEGQKLVLL